MKQEEKYLALKKLLLIKLYKIGISVLTAIVFTTL